MSPVRSERKEVVKLSAIRIIVAEILYLLTLTIISSVRHFPSELGRSWLSVIFYCRIVDDSNLLGVRLGIRNPVG